MIRILLTLILFLALVPATVASAATCAFHDGFAALHDAAPDRIGDCLEDAQPQPNGDVQQHTANGLLAWRKADNWTAFTNGSITLLNGPCGLQERPNQQRFVWEIPGHEGCEYALEEGLFMFNGSMAFPSVIEMDSEPFTLQGGAYAVAWKIDAPHFCFATLNGVNGTQAGGTLISSDGAGARQGEGSVGLNYPLPAGTYVIHLTNCGTWAIALAR